MVHINKAVSAHVKTNAVDTDILYSAILQEIDDLINKINLKIKCEIKLFWNYFSVQMKKIKIYQNVVNL